MVTSPEGLTYNEQFFDALVRHQIGLLRVSGSIRNKIYALLDATEKDIGDEIRRRLANAQGLERPSDVTRLERLLKFVRATRLKAWKQVDAEWVRSLQEIAKLEPDFMAGIVKTVVPVQLNLELPSTSRMIAMVNTRPMQGRVMKSWSKDLAAIDIKRIEDQIRIGLLEGETGPQVARRVVGSAALAGTDGVTEITRRAANAITRTAVNTFSNSARQAFYEANAELIQIEVYVATLDERTTPICRSLDGQKFKVGEGPVPPRHWMCRSLRVATLDGELLGNRPMKPFTERQFLREYAERNGFRAPTTRAGLPHGTRGAFDEYARGRVRELTGRVPARTNYQTFLERQPASFQEDVLGKTRALLFRRGGLKLTKFVNRKGDELTLSQLAVLERDAFIKAGLNPEDFL